MFKPNANTVDFYKRGRNDKNFPFEIEGRKKIL